jgi:hypothetical protein
MLTTPTVPKSNVLEGFSRPRRLLSSLTSLQRRASSSLSTRDIRSAGAAVAGEGEVAGGALERGEEGEVVEVEVEVGD